MSQISKMTEEDFIQQFGCTRKEYDQKLCEREAEIMKAREEEYKRENKKTPETFIGQKIYYNMKWHNIVNIRYAPGYPEHFEPYYSIYSRDSNGKEIWIINQPESEFYEGNQIFSGEPMVPKPRG